MQYANYKDYSARFSWKAVGTTTIGIVFPGLECFQNDIGGYGCKCTTGGQSLMINLSISLFLDYNCITLYLIRANSMKDIRSCYLDVHC